MVDIVKGVGVHPPPLHNPTRLGKFFRHDEIYARKLPLPLWVYPVFLIQVSWGGGGVREWRLLSVYIQTHTSSSAAVSLRGEDPHEDPRETQGKAACWSTFQAVGSGDAAAQHQKTGIPIFSPPYVRHNQSISTHYSLRIHVKPCCFWSLKKTPHKKGLKIMVCMG